MTRLIQIALAGMLLSMPALIARSIGPTVPASAVPTDGTGGDCTMCHTTFRPANSDPRGKLEILVESMTYTPGVTKKIRVRLTHPEASRWGFQMTSRQSTDTTKGAGTWVGNDTIQVKCGLAITNPPCAGEPEPQFVEHVPASTRPGTREGVEWEIEWKPPINEVGDVVLYAAGNAANNNGINTGDYIYTTNITLKAEGACNQTRRPSVRTIGNAASFARDISPNAMASVFGLDFAVAGRSRAVGSGDLIDGKFPTELACVAVEVAGRRSPVTYVQNDQINFQVPAATPAGPVSVLVILNPGRQNELRADMATVTVNNYAPAFFTFSNKSIAALTSDFKILADPSVVPGGVAAKRGDIVSLFGTGFGLSNPVYQAGEIPGGATPLRDAVTVTIGGTTLAPSDIFYAGLAPGNISGLQQFNVRIPQSAATGNVPVTITIGGVTTVTTGAVIPVQ